jgi:LysR family hca operon transcriptional activator
MPDLAYKFVAKERFVAVLPRNHRLALLDEIDPREFSSENFMTVSSAAPMVKVVIEEFMSRWGLDTRTIHEIDNLAVAVSLVASTGGVCLLPSYAENILPISVISRPLAGDPPTIDLVVGYSKTNTSQTLQRFLSRVDDLIPHSRQKQTRPGRQACEKKTL